MKILMTGATGFLGGRALTRLSRRHEVWAITRRPRENEHNVHWLVQDLTADTWTVDLPSQADSVVHLAQSTDYRNFPAASREIYSVSAGTTMRLLDWARGAGVKNFVLASTGGVYGTSNHHLRENDPIPDPCSPIGFYLASKRAAELLTAQYAQIFTAIILRFFFVYGSGQAHQMLMPRLVKSVRESQPIFLHGKDGIRLNPIHVDDAAVAVERATNLTQSAVINVAGPQICSVREIVSGIAAVIGGEPVFKVENSSSGDLVADIGRMHALIGSPAIDLKTGIAELCRSEAS